MDETQKLNFVFTVQEINAILSALGQGSYVQVAQLIENIKTQAAPQIQQAAPSQEPPKE